MFIAIYLLFNCTNFRFRLFHILFLRKILYAGKVIFIISFNGKLVGQFHHFQIGHYPNEFITHNSI